MAPTGSKIDEPDPRITGNSRNPEIKTKSIADNIMAQSLIWGLDTIYSAWGKVSAHPFFYAAIGTQ